MRGRCDKDGGGGGGTLCSTTDGCGLMFRSSSSSDANGALPIAAGMLGLLRAAMYNKDIFDV